MSRSATALAHPNIALAKYWGKREAEAGAIAGKNVPAVPSLSVTLSGLSTRTTVTVSDEMMTDAFVLGDVLQTDDSALKIFDWLEAFRAHYDQHEYARVESFNDFPTASGLASSASGFAALARAASAAYELDLEPEELSRWAQRGSTSAARSVLSGYVELVPGRDAAQVAPPDHLPLSVLVCVTSEGPKASSSRSAMAETQAKSPYYERWVEFSHQNFEEQRKALLAKDFDALGAALEASALAMHASAMAAGIVYFNQATLAALAAVRGLRERGLSVWASMDAGPHVKAFVQNHEVEAARAALAQAPGVLRVLTATPGPGATLL